LYLLEPLGIHTEDTSKHLVYSEEAKSKIDKLLAEKDVSKSELLAGIVLSAGNKIKEWPLERFAEVADYLVKECNVAVVLIGGPKDACYGRGVLSHMKGGNIGKVADLTASLSLEELKALIAHLDFLIGVDTGPIYIAEAFGVSTVDLVGPMDEREQPPIGRLHRVVVPPERAEPQLHIMNARIYDTKEARRQVESITSAHVIAEVDILLQELQKNL